MTMSIDYPMRAKTCVRRPGVLKLACVSTLLTLSLIVAGCSGEKVYSDSGANIPEGVDHSFIPKSDFQKMVTTPTHGLEYVATGTNPDWTIHAVLTSLTYISPQHQNGIEITAASKIDGSTVVFTGELESEPLTLELRPAHCIPATPTDDPKLKATLTLGSKTFHGCSTVG